EFKLHHNTKDFKLVDDICGFNNLKSESQENLDNFFLGISHEILKEQLGEDMFCIIHPDECHDYM
ncbi:MAG: hypothetical protein AAF153_02340, partial [Pseudomonadota bacterium]